MNSIRVTVALCCAFIVAVVTMFVVSVTKEPQLSDEELRDQGVFLLPRPRELAPFSLEDHLGDAFTNAQLEGRWTFAFFGFTHCPDICPTSMSVLGQVDAQLQGDQSAADEPFQGLLVTVDPDRDTQEKLATYTTAFSPRFTGVRGSVQAIGELANQVNVSFGKVPLPDSSAGDYTVDHTGNIVIINPRGHYHGFIKLPHKAETIRLTYQSLRARF